MVNITHEAKISSNSRLLFLSCSQSKRPTKGALPALERYDGPRISSDEQVSASPSI